MRIAYVSILALGCLFSTAQNAYATPEVNEENAVQLERELRDYAKRLLAGKEFMLDAEASDIKDYSVTPAGDHYRFEIPVYSYKTGSNEFELGPFTGTAKPKDHGPYDFTVDVGNRFPLAVKDIAGANLFSISAAKGEISGIMDPEIIVFPQLLVNFSDLLIQQTSSDLSIGLKSLTFQGRNFRTDDGTPITTSNSEVSGMNVISDSSTVTLGKIISSHETEGADPYATIESMREPKTTDSSSMAQVQETLNRIVQSYGTKTKGHLEIRDASISFEDSTPLGRKKYSLSRVFTSQEVTSDDEHTRSNVNFDFGHEGLSITPLPLPSLAAVLPITSRFSFEIVDIPTIALIKQLAAIDITSPEAEAQIMSAIQEEMAQAGTMLKIEELAMRASDLSANMTGTIVPDAESPYGAVARLTARMIGLDELVGKLGRLAGQGSETSAREPDYAVNGLFMASSVLQMQGRSVEDRVPSERTYDLELTKAGGFLVNGVDLGLVRAINRPQQAPSSSPEVNLPSATE